MKPFEGIRVLDLTHVLAGPFSTFQLACLGADVIKIESPVHYDMTRIEGVNPKDNEALYGSGFQSQNANKRGITLDLKSSVGCDVMWRLVESADVLVQNYSGDTLEKLGFGYNDVSDVNPKIIYCSISGFGSTGPKAKHPAYDVVIQAFSGLMAANGETGRDPVRVGPPMVDYGTGAQAALAISSALFQRQQSGRGQFIDVSMLDAALMMMSTLVVDTTITEQAPVPHGNIHPVYAGYAAYDTADGQLMLGAFTNKQFASLLHVLGESKRAEEVINTARQDIPATYSTDIEIISDKLLSKTANEWEQLLNDAHVPASRVRTLKETLSEEQLNYRGVLQSTDTDRDGCPERLPVTAFSFLHGGPSVTAEPPTLGEHTREVLNELGYTEAEIDKMQSARAI